MLQRQPVEESPATGIKAIDAMTAIGRGQRQLIIGDRKTGKTAVCIDAILNQKDNWKTGDPGEAGPLHLRRHRPEGLDGAGVKTAPRRGRRDGVHDHRRGARVGPGRLQWFRPYTGSALGQHWMYAGKHVLIVFDDLSKQAEAYRAISLAAAPPAGPRGIPRRRLLTCTRVCWSVRRSSPTRWAAAR